MTKMTQERIERFTEVMWEKYHWQLNAWPTREEGLRSIIQGVIADTHMLDTDTITLERWEQAVRESLA